jgi:hypothetical protein
MRNSFILLGSVVFVTGMLGACGSSESGLDEGPGTGGTSGADGGSAGVASGGAAGTASGGSAGAACVGSDPTEDGGERRCPEGECRCASSTGGNDRCLPEGHAAACCGEGELECFREGGKFDCKGVPPQNEDGKRFCLEGTCLCEGRNACLPAAEAAACCPDTPKC